MRRNCSRQRDQLTTRGLAQIVAVEVLQLVFAHVQRAVGGVVQRNELAVTAGDFDLANDEGGDISHISLDRQALWLLSTTGLSLS